MMHRSSKFVRNEKAQIITLAGVIIALTVVLLAIVINTAAISGQRTAMQEVDDAHYVFKNVRDVYGDVLRQLSDEGNNPFENETLVATEQNIIRMCNAHGFSVLFKDKFYDSSVNPPTATALLIFSDGDTIYRDRVTYTLAWIVQRLPFVEGSLNVSSSEPDKPDKLNDTISFNVTNIASQNVTIDKMRVSWDPSKSNEKLEEIWISTEVWGKFNAKSGEIVDLIPNATIASGETVPITLIFKSDMPDKIFTVEFIYTDGLSDYITFET